MFEPTRCGIKEKDHTLQAVALTSVMSKWYARCVVLRLKKEKELEGRKQLYVGGVDGLRLDKKSWKLLKHPGSPGHPGKTWKNPGNRFH